MGDASVDAGTRGKVEWLSAVMGGCEVCEVMRWRAECGEDRRMGMRDPCSVRVGGSASTESVWRGWCWRWQ